MELVTLNASNQADKLIENYDSLIWTERFNTVGDFQLIAGDVATFMTLLPEGKIVSLRESNVAMVVETHKIERKKNTPEQITITGRSFESILDRRVAMLSVTAGSTSDWTVTAKAPSDVSFYIVNRICVLGDLDADDIFPPAGFLLSGPADYYTGTGPDKIYAVPKGNLLTAVLGLLQTETKEDTTTSPVTPAFIQRGIRAVRPNSAGTAITLQWYQGTDRSATVYFDATRDLLDDGKYLFSKVGSATMAYIIGTSNAAKLSKTLVPVTGFDRRVILVDAIQSGEVSATTLQMQAEQSLAEAAETHMFDGSINQDLSPYKYNVDYFLGDTVKLVADYGMSHMAVVTEYIRSEDTTGTKSYPTLAAADL